MHFADTLHELLADSIHTRQLLVLATQRLESEEVCEREVRERETRDVRDSEC